MTDPRGLGRHDSWEGVRAVVAGFGVSGFAAADNLNHLGASVVALDESDADDRAEKAELLEVLGADVRLGPGSTATLPDDVDVVVTSPGWKPTAPLLAQATERRIPVWGEVELAWRLRDPEHSAPWLAVTGTNGKTTTVQMLQSILTAAGLRAVAVGNDQILEFVHCAQIGIGQQIDLHQVALGLPNGGQVVIALQGCMYVAGR